MPYGRPSDSFSSLNEYKVEVEFLFLLFCFLSCEDLRLSHADKSSKTPILGNKRDGSSQDG